MTTTVKIDATSRLDALRLCRNCAHVRSYSSLNGGGAAGSPRHHDDNLADQVGNGARAIGPHHGAGQTGQPLQVARKVAAFTAAVIVMGRPFDELFRLLVPPAARRDRVG